MSISLETKRTNFRKLHEEGTLILTSPWDIGGLRRLEKLGAKAIATTSAGFSWHLGREDFEAAKEEVLAHLTQLCAATDLPVNADFQSGFADAPADLAENVKQAIETGIAGLSIEDRTGDQLYSPELSVERIRACRQAIDETGQDVLLVARCEGLLIGTADMDEVITRLKAYADAGADVLFAPGVMDKEHIKSMVDAVAPKPLNVLLLTPDMEIGAVASLGVRRFSTGFALAQSAWAGFEVAAASVLQQGRLPG